MGNFAYVVGRGILRNLFMVASHEAELFLARERAVRIRCQETTLYIKTIEMMRMLSIESHVIGFTFWSPCCMIEHYTLVWSQAGIFARVRSLIVGFQGKTQMLDCT